jgi:hypothetical protein
VTCAAVGAAGAVWAASCFPEKPEIKLAKMTAKPHQTLQAQQQLPLFSEDSEGIDDFSPDRSGAQGRSRKMLAH